MSPLFKHGENLNQFGYIGWGNTGTQFFGYYSGYKDAADVLVDKVLSEGDSFSLDRLIYPIVFLYRQSLELLLKHIFIEYADMSRDDTIRTIKSVSHNLISIWNKVKPLLEKVLRDDPAKDKISWLNSVIIEFDEHDRNSFNFRYPITRNGDRIHSEHQYIDYPNLKDEMNNVYDFLETIQSMLDYENQLREDEYE